MSGVTLGAHGTYVANAAASVTDGAWRIALGCVAAVPVRATAVEERLAGSEPDEASVRAAVEGLGATLDPPSDVHASADYRRSLAETSRRARRPPGSRASEGVSVAAEPTTSQSIDRDRERRAVRDGGAGAPAPRPLPPRRPRPDRARTSAATPAAAAPAPSCSTASLVKSCAVLAVQADGASVDDRRGPRGRRRALRAPAGRSPTTTRCSAATARRGC